MNMNNRLYQLYIYYNSYITFNILNQQNMLDVYL